MAEKYWNDFDGLNSVRSNYAVSDTDIFPREDELLYADYTYEDYSGSSFVLFEKDGTLYEVYGAHFSCYGLEDQWEPEATTWEALAMRQPDKDSTSDDALNALRALVLSHVPR